ncbi:FemAB-related protein, PEP-CTERM system-associated [Marinobacter sp. LV10R510-11A]|uniref:FemAB family XrtA/PEP-CTERM system-associated protein n=1 Tax=Marinobacter sp. LV10R510-11A TaxID=1415568 RepID=UPI000BB6859C|nr:FemAB family XrtA/PEP-CTERM system-associated protein [Marinobacter sp. LV10R510-11A]SOB75148.1 FemAB-related protein, PEP-CTERM system-associated [Marinobacter sp. LV10R510-11A]
MSADLQTQASRFNIFPKHEYDRYVASHPQATPYHRSAWLQATERAYGHTGWLITVHHNGSLCGVLPLVEVKPPIGTASLVSLPFCDLAGALADSADIAERLIAEAKTLAKTNRIKILEIREGGAVLEREAALETEQTAQALPGNTKVRMLCDLPESSEALFKSYKPKLRSQIRKAEKNGLRSELRTEADAVNLFYDVFAQNMRRLGSPVHSLQWFQELKAAYGEHMVIGVVFQNDTPVGAGIVLLGGKQACIPWASTLEEFNRLAPNMLLYWTLLSHVCDLGYTQFDFGRSTLNEGTYRFKKQWGAQPYELIWTTYRNGEAIPASVELNGTRASATSRLRPLIENIWRRMPLPFTNWLGPKLRRYITL